MALFTRVTDKVIPWVMTYARTRPKDHLLVVEHEIPRVTPEMITWWWANIQDTQRYKLWHPQDHQFFTWEIPPQPNHIGTIQIVRETIGGIPNTLRIRFDDPGEITTAYTDVLAGSILHPDNTVIARLTHEYKAIPNGTEMRSTFFLPRILYRLLHKGLRQHNIEEMRNFSMFLPELYAQNNRSVS